MNAPLRTKYRGSRERAPKGSGGGGSSSPAGAAGAAGAGSSRGSRLRGLRGRGILPLLLLLRGRDGAQQLHRLTCGSIRKKFHTPLHCSRMNVSGLTCMHDENASCRDEHKTPQWNTRMHAAPPALH